jgi:hypothetical protein
LRIFHFLLASLEVLFDFNYITVSGLTPKWRADCALYRKERLQDFHASICNPLAGFDKANDILFHVSDEIASSTRDPQPKKKDPIM